MPDNRFDNCDTEPINLIGSIQPHGCLIVVDEASLRTVFASQNTEAYLGVRHDDLLGRSLKQIIGESNCLALFRLPLDPLTPDLLRPWFVDVQAKDGTSRSLECLPHRRGGQLILEFVRRESEPATVWEEEVLRQRIISDLIKPNVLEELAHISAEIIRSVTGFDRVMIYRFADDKHGEVIAESTVRDDSFLGLHYPASDIPDPARRHFVLNVMRSIPDIGATPVPIVGETGTVPDASAGEPLDLTYSKLRAVAPVHVEYLNNMGVGASLSISLITNQELWGLIACHHYGKRHVRWSRLRFVELLGGTISALLQSIENTNQLRQSINAEKVAFTIEQTGRADGGLSDVVADHAGDLMDLLHAQGMVLTLGGRTTEYGTVPVPECDFANLRKAAVEGIATTSQLSAMIEMTEPQQAVAAGAAFLELSDDGADFLVFLREHFEETIKWAGKPEKIERTSKDGTVRLSPRGSFALWREERRGKSKPFDALDHEALRIVRRALFALNSLARERDAVAAQKRTEAEKARLRHALLDAARTSSMGELASAIAHELNQPLAAVSNYINACRQELRNCDVVLPENAAALFEDAVAESARAGDLVRRLRDFIARGDLVADHIDLNETIRHGIDLARDGHASADFELRFRLQPDLPKVWADPVQIAQVVLNLAKNSIAAMEGMPVRVLTVTSRGCNGYLEVSVSDTGRGVPVALKKTMFEPFHASTTSGMGIGLSLCRSIIEAHSGRIEARPASQGAELAFTLPTSGVGASDG